MNEFNKEEWASVAAGQPLVNFLSAAYAADMPVMLHGHHGIGKSAIIKAWAKESGMECLVIDLSLMEPSDLVGLPVLKNGKTGWATPVIYPEKGQGILLFEELNRCPEFVRQTCYQMMTARMIHQYRLPDDWLPCAAVNPSHSGYHTNELDPALLSRFANVQVCPNERQWAVWAQQNGVHHDIIEFIQKTNPFSDTTAPPRSWHYASNLLTQWEVEKAGDQELLKGLLAGVLTLNWAEPFIEYYRKKEKGLSPDTIVKAYADHRDQMLDWIDTGRLDLVQSSLWQLHQHLEKNKNFLFSDTGANENIKKFMDDIPQDLLQSSFKWLGNMGLEDALSDLTITSR